MNVPELNGKISKLTADQRKKFFELVPESCFNHDGKRKTLNLAKLQDHPEEAKKIVKKVNEWVESNKPKKSTDNKANLPAGLGTNPDQMRMMMEFMSKMGQGDFAKMFSGMNNTPAP